MSTINAQRDYDGALIAASKLHPPAAGRGTVIRRELLGRLDRDTRDIAVKLVLVVAPAGWGKTSLLGQWWRSSNAGSGAWLSLDLADNDPARFRAHLIAATKEAPAGHGTRAAESRVTVVVDNYHLISNPAVHECTEFFIENLPPAARLVLTSRFDPALPLARLRARGEIREIRADELRFSDEETAGLLNGALDLGLPPDQVRALRQRTQGWAAGLYLAGLSLRGHADLDRQHGSAAEPDCHSIEAVLALLSQASLSSAQDVTGLGATPGIPAPADIAAEPVRERRGHRPDGLTGREVEVFELLAAGKTNNEIAADLVVSVHTVERHLQNAYRKIGARNRGQAAAYIARAAGLARADVRIARNARRARWLISLMPQILEAGKNMY